NWRCTPATMRRTSFPRATARRSCAGYAARTRTGTGPMVAARGLQSVAAPTVPGDREKRKGRAMSHRRNRSGREANGGTSSGGGGGGGGARAAPPPTRYEKERRGGCKE